MLAMKAQGGLRAQADQQQRTSPVPAASSDITGITSPGEVTPEFPKTDPGEEGVKGSSTSTIVNTRSAVGIFERWLFDENGQDQRKIETIPPPELDHILTLFWIGVQSRTGQVYRAGTLNNLRARLERHLKVCGYPYSIVKSEIFARSRCAFRDRVMSCRTKEVSENAPEQPFQL